MRILLIAIFLLFNFFIAITAFAEEKLIFAIDVIRHGDCVPFANIPKASYQWPSAKLGQLTTKGMRQQYLLGSKLRKLYIDSYHLLPSQYAPETLYVFSTDTDRTLMSAESFLLGLYPLGTGPLLPESKQAALPSAFQVIPVHTTPQNLVIQSYDQLLVKFRKLLQSDVFSKPAWQEKNKELRPKFAAWSKGSGVAINDLNQLLALGDTLYINQLNHIPLPAGLSAQDAQEIIQAANWAFAAPFKLHAVGQQAGGNLLKVITNYLQQASQGRSQLKYVVFLAHGATLLSLMSAMSVPLDIEPPYDSYLNFSLYDKGNQQFIVRVKLNGETVKIPACQNADCSLKQFESLVK